MRPLNIAAVAIPLVLIACSSASKSPANPNVPSGTSSSQPVAALAQPSTSGSPQGPASSGAPTASPAPADATAANGAVTQAPGPSEAKGTGGRAAEQVTGKAALQELQNAVFALEDKVYGARKLGTLGLLGELKNCRRKLASRQFGGSGELVWNLPVDRVTEKESEVSQGANTDPTAQIARFKGYRVILQRRAEELQQNIEVCQAELAKREVDSNQSAKVMVNDIGRAPADKTSVNAYFCQFVKKGASLRELMVELFAKGWLSLADFRMDQNLISSASLMDVNKDKRDNGLMFSGWKLAFDQGAITVGALLSGDKDAKLKSWTYPVLSDVPGHESCLEQDGVWSP